MRDLTGRELNLIRRALVTFANEHERKHSCADATQARALAREFEVTS